MADTENIFSTEDTIDISDGLDLFGEEQTSEAPAEESETTDADTTAAEEAPQTYKIKYNGQEESYTLDQLTELAQKGRNYDKVKEKADKADSYKKSAEVIEAFAQAAGISVEDYLAQAGEQLSGRQIRELTDQGMSEDLAKELLELRNLKAKTDASKAESAKQKETEAAWNAFAEEFPEAAKGFVDKGLPQEIIDMVASGKTPTEAFLRYERTQKTTKANAEKANAENRKRSPGSAKGISGTPSADAFLRGFLS